MNEKKNLLIEKRNSEVFLRPRFSIDLDLSSEKVLNRFSNEFKKEETPFIGNIVDGHIFISVSKKEEHFWSPQLHLEILEQTNETSLLKGLFGPKPQVWTLFMFVHFVIGITFLGFVVLFYTRYSLKEPIFFPIIMLIFLPFIWTVLYFLGKIGKDTGKNQIRDLHDFMIKVINN
ncbi:GTP-binding protein [Polaribacter sp. MSW13]|uniref:GTP-binding protein n=1 Tax=Polaribacter marinus TaxID=2916838 RepID=A0A9X2ANS7_9FLAO|nr:GTP-binding protein [Polaribacter marinus]MCI2230234.1 GTP-binding protein [Polaribacter marinus]